MGDRRGAHKVLVGRPDVKRQLGRPRRRWEKIWKWMFEKWDVGMDWIALVWDRDRWRGLVNAVMDLRVP